MKYTIEQKTELNARKSILKINLNKILGNKAKLEAECFGDGKGVMIEGDGSQATQLFIAAAQATQIINTYGSESEGRHTIFLAAIEMQRGYIDGREGEDTIKVEV